MRRIFFAGGFALLAGLGFMPQVAAMPVDPGVLRQDASTATSVQYAERDRRPGYWRRHYYRNALRHYRGRPGAQYELRQNRRIFCRNTPERC